MRSIKGESGVRGKGRRSHCMYFEPTPDPPYFHVLCNQSGKCRRKLWELEATWKSRGNRNWWPPGGPSGGPPGGRLQRALMSSRSELLEVDLNDSSQRAALGSTRLGWLHSPRHQLFSTTTPQWHFHGGLWHSNLLISNFKPTILYNITKRAISGVIWTKFSKLSLFERKNEIAIFVVRPTLDCGEAYSPFHHILQYKINKYNYSWHTIT